eukprot:3277-Heterococcus_DN1.PRE.7
MDEVGFLAPNDDEPQCSVPCVWRYIRDHLKAVDSALADMLVMVDTWELGAFTKFAGQHTAFFGAEAWHTTEYIRKSYPWIDVSISPDETADVPTSYNLFNHSTLYDLDGKPALQDASSLAVWIHSYGSAWRNTMADQIAAVLNVDFLGPWRNNGNDQLMYPECANHPTGVRHRTNPCIYRHYKFVFATENAEVTDYTTEKYWYAIAAGAIPIVNGAPNSKVWMPPHSAIFTKDFNDNGTAIAEHILAVAANETAYAEYHAWRTHGHYYEPFQRKLLMSERNMGCNICIEGARLRLLDRFADTYNISGSKLGGTTFDMARLDHLPRTVFEQQQDNLTLLKFQSCLQIRSSSACQCSQRICVPKLRLLEAVHIPCGTGVQKGIPADSAFKYSSYRDAGESANGLQHALAQLHITSTVTEAPDDMTAEPSWVYAFARQDVLFIVFGAHLFKQLPQRYILMQMEQLSSPYITDNYIDSMVRALYVWDFSYYNAHVLKRRAQLDQAISVIPVHFVNTAAAVATQGHTADEHSNAPLQSIDVLFYGHLNERRNEILQLLRAANLTVRYEHNVLGAERDELIRQSKVVLNLHYLPDAALEVHRINPLLMLGKCIVSEPSIDAQLDAQYSSGI